MLFNLANAYERLGKYAQASVALRGYIPHADPAHQEVLEKRAARLEERAASEKTPPPAGAPVDAQPSIPVARAVGYGMSGLGALGLALGAGFGIIALEQRSQLDELCQTGAAGRLCDSSAQPLLEKDATFSALADASFIVGGIATALGVYLVIDARPHGEDVSLRIGPGSLHLGGSF